MNCPYCNEKMILGQIISRVGRNVVLPVFYIDEEHTVALTSSPNPLSIFTGDKLEGCYCPHCHKIILDVPEPSKSTKKPNA